MIRVLFNHLKTMGFLFFLTIGTNAYGEADLKPIAIVQLVSHQALDQTRKGVMDELKAQKLTDEKGSNLVYENAHGHIPTLAQIMHHLISQRPAVIITLATPTTQAAIQATDTIPIVFAAVTDPLKAKIVANLNTPEANATGTMDQPPLKEQLNFIFSFIPALGQKQIEGKKIKLGILYNPGEDNSHSTVEELKTLITSHSYPIEIIEGIATNTSFVKAAVEHLIAQGVEAIYLPQDNTVVSALDALIEMTLRARIPVFGSDVETVERGVTAVLGFDRYEAGRQTGKIVAALLRGEKPGNIPVKTPATWRKCYNVHSIQMMEIPVNQTMFTTSDCLSTQRK